MCSQAAMEGQSMELGRAPHVLTVMQWISRQAVASFILWWHLCSMFCDETPRATRFSTSRSAPRIKIGCVVRVQAIADAGIFAAK